MPEEPPHGHPEAPDEDDSEERKGAFAALLSPLREFAGRSRGHAADYVRARTELLSVEAEEAAHSAKGLAAAGGLGAVLLIPGYTLCVIAALQAFAGQWDASRFGILALIAGIVHLVLGIAILLRTRAKARATRFFEESREQLKRDQEWLTQLNPTPHPPNSAAGNPD
jgi:uncharacterized membrane protein YqjE